jgi:hypothetical protein
MKAQKKTRKAKKKTAAGAGFIIVELRDRDAKYVEEIRALETEALNVKCLADMRNIVAKFDELEAKYFADVREWFWFNGSKGYFDYAQAPPVWHMSDEEDEKAAREIACQLLNNPSCAI